MASPCWAEARLAKRKKAIAGARKANLFIRNLL
jgi:hypothetical protein